MRILKKMKPGQIISAGFALVILTGALILMLPFSLKDGQSISFINALFTSTSAVCVTGLVVVDTYTVFTPFGMGVVAGLIQIGGLGVTSVGVGIILAIGKRVDLRGRVMIREALNLSSGKGLVALIKSILMTTLFFEGIGAIINFLVFVNDYPLPRAVGMSIFHSIATFNNAGFDITGGMVNLIPYRHNVLLNLNTIFLIFFGGIGFLVIQDIRHRKRWKKLMLHSKIVITTTIGLSITGTVLLKLTEPGITWMGALFQNVSARTAGFSTYNLGTFTNASLLILALWMFIGASPGSTGGGIKTSTFFVVLQTIRAAARNKSSTVFHYKIAEKTGNKAVVITVLSSMVVCIGVFLMTIFEPKLNLIDILFEVISAFATTGLSTGITPDLTVYSKALEVIIMFIGRLGAMTIVSLWVFKPEGNANYPEGDVSVG